ncbi:peptidoglycan-binding protein [Streptomyces fildesensis]|uniref:Peptidoglycan-binding protein n=1 Tax=Streptomyces fildesensis TaxID=375757 RepID=A0ABW8CGC4_9ACTN
MPFCPRCADLLRCACAAAHGTATADRTTAAQFDQEWVRPYLSLPESAPGEKPPATTDTLTWVVPRVGRESDLPSGRRSPGPPVRASRTAGHRAPRRTRRRRPLRITAVLLGLIGSATIAGTYALSRGQDARDVSSPPPASRLDGLQVEGTPETTAPPARPRRSLPSRTPGTASPTVRNPVGASTQAGQAAPSTTTAASGTPADGLQQVATPSPSTSAPSAEKPTLRRYDTGPEVQELQRRLAEIGSWSLPQRGRYDRHLQDAVAEFQATHRVRIDPPGVYGPATRRLLEALTSS